jgi:hypothetical protein
MFPMANLTLIYGLRLLPEGEVREIQDATLKLANGHEAHVTMHVLEGSREQIEKQLKQRGGATRSVAARRRAFDAKIFDGIFDEAWFEMRRLAHEPAGSHDLVDNESGLKRRQVKLCFLFDLVNDGGEHIVG